MKYFITLLFVVCFVCASSQIPQQITFQSYVQNSDGSAIQDGSYNITLNLYEVDSGGVAIWTETHTLNISDGILNVILGSVSNLNLNFTQQYWLGISIEGGAELIPRIALTSSAYSLISKTVENGAITG